MKKTTTKNSASTRDSSQFACCSRKQKIWGVVALVGLFACGWMVGVSVRSLNSGDAIAADASASNVSECDIIEYHLKRDLEATEIESKKIPIYKNLIEYGCPENVAEYKAHLKGLEVAQGYVAPKQTKRPVSTCTKIEQEYKTRLNDVSHAGNGADAYIWNAKIYAILAERGCPVNHEKYTVMARQSLELARAISDDEWWDNYETIEVVETYKRINMQAAAEEIIDKVKKLSNPAIDFIIQLEKIINE